MVKLRLKRMGRRHRSEYRICAMDARSARNGKAIEEVGSYHPQTKDESKQFFCKEDRVKHWLSVGAQPTETVHDLFAKAGLIAPLPHRKTKEKQKKNKD